MSVSTERLLRRLHHDGVLELPRPGTGRTADRHLALMDIAHRFPVGVGRLAEAHCDAVAILREAEREPRPGALYGVWASNGGGSGPTLSGNVLDGSKSFCSGLGIVDRALMTVHDERGGSVLLDVDARRDDTVAHDITGWSTWALTDTNTGSVTYRNHEVDDDAVVGGPDWYLQRPGFWHGACGPAACWAGSTSGVVAAARSITRDDPHQLAHLGAMEAIEWALRALLVQAGQEIDASPGDALLGERRARSLRHTTERLCADVLDRFGRAFGPRPFTTDPVLAQRVADTHLFLRQHHGERELGALADVARTADA